MTYLCFKNNHRKGNKERTSGGALNFFHTVPRSVILLYPVIKVTCDQINGRSAL